MSEPVPGRPAVKKRAPRNRPLVLEEGEQERLQAETFRLDRPQAADTLVDRVVQGDLFSCLEFLPDAFIDLLIADPPYNLDKDFAGRRFRSRPEAAYRRWLESWLVPLKRCLKKTASLYVCCDWRSSKAVQTVLEEHYRVRNRITWEREKGRGAKKNWKNCAEDIWFATVSDDYFFDVEAVKLKRRVIAPYRDPGGRPRDWDETAAGNFRLTHPSNLWTDISIPFWSMPENTDHPTQKPEKLIAKLVLASSRRGDLVCDPFAGSGTSCVVATKLERRYLGIELEPDYCALAGKRLARARDDRSIQGYRDGCFWERNSRARKR
jgi:site-specific DNA-methyltransferase (adenine-specific)